MPVRSLRPASSAIAAVIIATFVAWAGSLSTPRAYAIGASRNNPCSHARRMRSASSRTARRSMIDSEEIALRTSTSTRATSGT